MLKIQVKNPRQSTQQNAIWVVERLYSIGCDPSDNLILIDDSVIPKHASLITLDNRLYLKDNNSPHGCYVNGKKISKKEVVPGDTVSVGQVDILVLDPRESLNQDALSDEDLDDCWSLIADGSFLTGQEFYIHKNPSIIGRGSQCDIVLPGTHLSRQHAELKIHGNLLHVRDLASSNGTCVNGNRISEGIAKPGDQIKFDAYSFQVSGPMQDKNKTQVRTAVREQQKISPSGDVDYSEKRWQTKPTSPGNRALAEEDMPGPTRQVFSYITLICMLGVLGYLVYPLLRQ